MPSTSSPSRSHLSPVPRPIESRRVEFVPPPDPLTSLVGRERDLTTITALLCDPAVRLVTLTGPGGVGKTRLALRMATDLVDDRHFPDGVVFVELVAIRDPGEVAPAIAQTLGVRGTGDQPIEAALKTALSEKSLLLVLDNFEQVRLAGPLVVDLLKTCSHVTALVTSRVRLRVSGEYVVPVTPLSLPGYDTPGESEAVRLFVDRTREANPAFTFSDGDVEPVAEIVRRLDGLPLAIELAAARGALFSPAALLARLEHRLPQLTNGPRDQPERHQTMRSAIAWSYDLLTPEEQRVFRSLGVFVGGCALDAAEFVCDERAEGGRRKAGKTTSSAIRLPPSAPIEETIESLVHHSLLSVVPRSSADVEPGTTRVVMLETVREFALERLAASGGEARVREAHARWCLWLAEAGDAAFRIRRDHPRWLTRLHTEHANLRAALSWMRDSDRAEQLLQMAGALAGFWYFRGLFSEGRRWLGLSLERDPGGSTAMRARALQSAGHLAHCQGDDGQSVSLLEESIVLSRASGDQSGTAVSLLLLAIVFEDRGDYREAEPRFEEALALFEVESQPMWAANTRCHLGIVALGQGDLVRARTVGEQALEQCRNLGDAWGTVMCLDYLSLIAVEGGELPRATGCLAEGLSIAREVVKLPGSRLRSLACAATLGAVAGRPNEAARLFGAVTAMNEVLGLNFELPERASHERAIATVRARLSEPDFARAWSAGQTLSLDDAIDEGLALVTTLLTFSHSSLTPRESEILRLLATDMTIAAIADALFVGVRTVETHIAHIFTKLDVRSRTDAVAAARALGLVEGGGRKAEGVV